MNEKNLQFVLASAVSYKMMREKLDELAATHTQVEKEAAEEFYTNFGYTLSLEIIDKINLAEEIGAEYLQKLQVILENDKGYNIFALLATHDEENGIRFCSKQQIQAEIDVKHAVILMRQQSFYQRFDISEKLKKHFYPGDILFDYRSDMKIEEAMELAQRILTNPQANDLEKGEFYPKFRQEMETIMGEGNFVYDFWEFGGKESSLFWYIRKDAYPEVMKKISSWLKYIEIEKLVTFSIVQ